MTQSEEYDQIEFQLIREHLVNFFRRVEWDTQYKLKIEKADTQGHLLEAYIDPNEWVIHITYPPGFIEQFIELNLQYGLLNKFEPTSDIQMLTTKISDDLQNKAGKDIYGKILRDFLEGISLHEFGHSNECPIDKDRFSIIVQAMSTALEQENKYNDVVLAYLMNLFMDLIINIIYGLEDKNQFFRNSLFLFHISEITKFSRTSNVDFAYFVLLNTRLYQFHPQIHTTLEDLVIDYLPNDFEEITHQFLQIFCPNEKIIDNMTIGQKLTENERWTVTNYVSDVQNWGKMAYYFAELMSRYVSPAIVHEDLPITDNSFVKEFFEDEFFKGGILNRIVNRKIEINEELQKAMGKRKPYYDQNPQLGNFGDDDLEVDEDSEGEEEDEGQNEQEIDNGEENQPPIKPLKQGETYPGEFDFEYGLEAFDPVKIFNDLYEQRVKKLEIEIKKEKEESHLPLTWMGRKRIDENEGMQNFDPLNVYFLPNSEELLAYKKIMPYTIPNSGSHQSVGFPDLAFICDNSGSMGWDPISGRGYYDAVIISIYSILEWLKTKNFASVIKYNLISFSSSTRETGWLDYFNIDTLKAQLFDYEGGGTILDLRIFKNLVGSSKKKAILLITDGEIANSEELRKLILTNQHNMTFLFIQIGTKSDLYRKLEKKGINVFQILDITKLSKIMLKFVKIAYGF